MATLQAHSPDIECDGCANSIKRSLGKLDGIEGVAVDVEAKNVTVEYAPETVTEATIKERLEKIGFPVS